MLASIDGEFTLKTYCQDEEGLRWLVPQNELYSPILLTEQSNARIYGRVKEIVKPAPRMKFSECMKTIRKAKLEAAAPKRVTREQAAEAIREVAPTVQVTVDDRGIPSYEIKQHVAWDHIPFTAEMEAVARECRAVCFGSLAQRHPESRATILHFLDAVSPDCLKIFDINLRQQFYTRDIIEESLHRCNILKINNEELAIISPLLGKDKQQLIADYGLAMLVLTCGTNGSYIITPDATSFLPTPKVDVVDTVGAGDSFTGALVASLLSGKNIREAHQAAVEVSAFVCTQAGAMPHTSCHLCRDAYT